MNANLSKFYVTNFLTGFILWYGIEKLFMRSIGISPLGIAINAIVYIAISVGLNIPVGVLADRWNRKYVIMIGIVFLAASSLVMGLSHGLLMYSIGTALWGLYAVCEIGTYNAIIYDTLSELGRTQEYNKIKGQCQGLLLTGVAISAVLGGYLSAATNYRYAYFVSIIPCLINLVLLSSVKEPVFHKSADGTKIRSHINDAITLIKNERVLLYLGIIYVGIALLRNTLNEYFGLYFVALGLGAVSYGWATAAQWMSNASGNFSASKTAKHRDKIIVALFSLFIIFTLIHSVLGIVFFFGACYMQAASITNLDASIQKYTRSNIRATMLSVLEFSSDSMMIPLSIFFGLIANKNIYHAFLFIGIVGLIFLAIWRRRPRQLRHSMG